jgi:hypothetical protein
VGAAVTVGFLEALPSAGGVFVDPRSSTTDRWHYRWRHTGLGVDPGAWSAWMSAKPALLSRQVLLAALNNTSVYPLLRSEQLSDGKYALKASDTIGKETDDDLFISATKTVKVGTVASPSSITKTLRVPFAECIPSNSAQAYTTGLSSILPLNANELITLRSSIVLPKGVTITVFRARMLREDATNDVAEAKLYRVNDDATASLIATATHTGTGLSTVSAALTQLVGDQSYTSQVQLKGFAQNNDAFFVWCEIEYTVPSYDKGI